MKLTITALVACSICYARADETGIPDCGRTHFEEQQREIKLEKSDHEAAESAQRYRAVKEEYNAAYKRYFLPLTRLQEERERFKNDILQADMEYQRRAEALSAAKERHTKDTQIKSMIDAHRQELLASGQKGFVDNHRIHLLLLNSDKADHYRSLLSASVERQKEIKALQHAVGAREVEVVSSSKELPALWDHIQSLRYSLSKKMASDASMQSLKERMEEERKRHEAFVATKLNANGRE